MLIMTAKLSKGKIALALLAAAAMLILVLRLAAGGGGSDSPAPQSGLPEPSGVTGNEDRVAYLAALGYTVQPEPVQTQEVSIPTEFNEVFTRYNELQQSQGFDLAPYAGKRAKRYVYRVTGGAEGDNICATLLIYKDTVIGADLSCAEGEGFLRALLPGPGAAQSRA